ncbi:MAG TPA: hypothetical protein V6D16_22660, partial [Candidatus Obscuribacterales bacterium]
INPSTAPSKLASSCCAIAVLSNSDRQVFSSSNRNPSLGNAPAQPMRVCTTQQEPKPVVLGLGFPTLSDVLSQDRKDAFLRALQTVVLVPTVAPALVLLKKPDSAPLTKSK